MIAAFWSSSVSSLGIIGLLVQRGVITDSHAISGFTVPVPSPRRCLHWFDDPECRERFKPSLFFARRPNENPKEV